MSLPLSGPARNSDLFYKQHHNNPVFQSDDLDLIKLWNYFGERARLSAGTIRLNGDYLSLEKGQLLFGRFQASKDLNISEWKIRDRVKKLIGMELIRKVGEKGGKMGYSIYQITSLEDHTPTAAPPKESPQASPSETTNDSPLENGLPTTPSPDTKEPQKASSTYEKEPPQIVNSDTEPLCEVSTSTKEKDKPLKEKTNKQEKRKVPPTKPLTEEDVCLSHPVIIRNDFQGSLQRFGQDFLDYLQEKAKKYTNNSSNPIGLLIHMLRTGAYRAEYADIKKQRKQAQEQKEALKRQEEKRELEIKERKEELKKSLEQSRQLLQEDEEFRNQVKIKINSTLRLMSTFLKNVLPEGFTVEDILENKRALSFYSQDLKELLQLRGIHV